MKNTIAQELLNKTIARIDGAYSPSTIRAYKANFESFIRFCDERNECAFPAKSDLVADYIKKLSDGYLKSASIRIAIAAISSIHRLNDLADPTQYSTVKIEMRRMFRSLGREAKQAYGITKPLLEKMMAVGGKDLRGTRDRALLSLAYDTMCRRSELISLRIEDIVYSDGNMRIKLRKSKTDQQGLGRTLAISEEATEYVLKWLEILEDSSGPIFRGVKGNVIQEKISAAQVNRIYKYLAKKASFDPEVTKSISGHSMRVGAAQDLLKSGASLATIMNKGRWNKTDTVMRYVENTNFR